MSVKSECTRRSTNISKFQFDLDVRHFSHEPLARVIAQALPVLDVKFTFTFCNYRCTPGSGWDSLGPKFT